MPKQDFYHTSIGIKQIIAIFVIIINNTEGEEEYMQLNEENVRQALSAVIDPDFGQDIITLNMVKNIIIEGNKVKFELELTTPACPLKEKFRQDCTEAIAGIGVGNVEVDIDMTADVTSIRDEAPLLPGVRNIIAVASGKGGVGKSTVSSNLAVSLAKTGAKVGLVDADIFGPSIPTMFNCEKEQPSVKQVDGKNLIIPVEQYGVKLLSIGFLSPQESAIVWRGPMASSALKQFLSDTEWGELDYLLIDLPPGTSDIHLTLVQSVSVTGAVVVSTPQKVALADAIKGISMFQQDQINVPVLGLVENMAYFTPEELPDNKYYIFGKDGVKNLAAKNKVPFLGEVPLIQGIRESGDNGYPAALKEGPMAEAFLEIAENFARQVAIRNANLDPTKIVNVS
jgi:ATP-binding protein involved in chromosome partitioning